MHSDYLYIQELPTLSQELNLDICTVRDDHYPFYFGGNKARKSRYIMQEISDLGCNAVVTTGGIQSNHARVVALGAAERNWPCVLVLHGEGNEEMPRGNEKIMRLTGAIMKIVKPTDIANTIKESIEQLTEQRYKPYEVPGGGHCLAGSLAYADVIEQLKKLCNRTKWYPDYIIHASGTGTTQAGLLCGLRKIGWETRVIGISIARCNPYGGKVVQEAYRQIMEHLECSVNLGDVDFRDDWICGGYEKADRSVFRTIGTIAKMEGLILDPTYTGKAFNGMLNIIDSGEIPRYSKVIFWHTGGLMNLLASEQSLTSFTL
ncbi:MAG: pyridoxal-phosphate dependent enzyme [Candidatus Hatepunaea meridiana]|nr:pyridoxal-phosphate dependent enzyme [Candidatus Hatepunaea meridiana]